MQSLFNCETFDDKRGVLRVLDEIPFAPKRAFWITDVPQGQSRGDHAHRSCEQFIVCLRGRFLLKLRSLGKREHLFDPLGEGQAVHVPPRTLVTIRQFQDDAICLVLASDAYDPNDVIDSREFEVLS